MDSSFKTENNVMKKGFKIRIKMEIKAGGRRQWKDGVLWRTRMMSYRRVVKTKYIQSARVCANTWDGGKSLQANWGRGAVRGLSHNYTWVRGTEEFRRRGGDRNRLFPWLPQELGVNWSCSMGFFTQAPSPALWKALMSACLAEWYSVAACLASW